MSCFRVPQSILSNIERECAKFWWGSNAESRKLHWKKWDYMCKPKCQGGMGFRKLEIFNKALLAKQIWRILRKPNSLVGRVLKARYFKQGDIMQAQLGSNPSFVWRSLLSSRTLLEDGLYWTVGNGKSIRIFHDKWVPKVRNFINNNGSLILNEIRVDALIKDGRRDDEAIRGSVLPYIGDEIHRIPLPQTPRDDSRYWKYDSKGRYSVKEGYRMGIGLYDMPAKQTQFLREFEVVKVDFDQQITLGQFPLVPLVESLLNLVLAPLFE
ncbi:putative mitochondrial protein AtMg00310 [Primulina tabacum]|uniref:putative mitochondrial protein AtMg00310 n=1 Tax=Primulina tabacum TaxID=48773 RepID=UPI003F59B194